MSITLTLKAPRPRNPLVVPARRRRAGAHGARGGARRQQAAHALRLEIDRLHSP